MKKKLPTSSRDLGTETVSRLSKKKRFVAKLLENESPKTEAFSVYKSAGSRELQQRKPDGRAFDKWELEEKGERAKLPKKTRKKMESFGTQKRTK